MMLGVCDRCDPRTPELSEDLVIIGWVETHGDVAGSLLIQEVDASQEDPGIGPRPDVLYGSRRLFRVDEFILSNPGTFQD